MRRINVFLLAATIAAALSLGAGAGTASAATECGLVSGVRWCNAPSTDYPKTIGWYGYVGLGGGPCNQNPRGTTFPEGIAGICAAPAPEVVWRWTGTTWVQARLNDGTRGYVYPYTADWRWIY